MIGQLIWTGERRLGIRLRWARVWNVAVLRAELPGSAADRGAARRRARGVCLLERAGCTRLLEGTEGLPGVSTRPLWQTMAAPLVLSFFRQNGQRPERASVALEGDRVSRPLFDACCQLVSQVRSLSLAPCPGSEELAWWLERQYGMPVSAGGGDVTVRFAPGESGARPCLALGEPEPEPPGFTLEWRGGTLPEEYPRLPLLTLLWESGKVRAEEMEVVFQIGDTKTRGKTEDFPTVP